MSVLVRGWVANKLAFVQFAARARCIACTQPELRITSHLRVL